MLIKDEATQDRVSDAERHDAVFIMVGEPGTDRPLLKLSVTKWGDALVEFDDGDLAAGIRQLSAVLSQALAAAGSVSVIQAPAQ